VFVDALVPMFLVQLSTKQSKLVVPGVGVYATTSFETHSQAPTMPRDISWIVYILGVAVRNARRNVACHIHQRAMPLLHDAFNCTLLFTTRMVDEFPCRLHTNHAFQKYQSSVPAQQVHTKCVESKGIPVHCIPSSGKETKVVRCTRRIAYACQGCIYWSLT
jgi:hypothetical protein